MKAKLSFQNVGGLRGQHNFEFEKGKLSIIKGSNASGKSSVVRALLAVLSVPADGDFQTRFFLREAEKLGIVKHPMNPIEGFVNIHENVARVSFRFDGTRLNYEIKQDGSYVTLPMTGDRRFLLAGILAGNSKISRQLTGLDDTTEPDDFRWAVSELSFASSYETLANEMITLKENYEMEKDEAKRKLDEISDLGAERSTLETQKQQLTSILRDLREKNQEIKDLFEKRQKIIDSIQDNKNKLSNYQTDVNIANEKLPLIKSQLEHIEVLVKDEKTQLSKLNQAISSINKKELVTKLDEEIQELVQKRNLLEGSLNLYVTAQYNLRRNKEEVTCFLCNQGKISFSTINKKLNDLRGQKDNFNSQIQSLNYEKRQLDAKFSRLEGEREKIRTQINNLTNEKRDLETESRNLTSTISGNQSKIEKTSSDIENSQKRLKEIIEKIPPEYEKSNVEYTEKEQEDMRISERIIIVNQKLSEANIPLLGKLLRPQYAIRIYNKWISFLDKNIKFAQQRADEQRKKATQQFNQNTQKFMSELGFREFRDVALNNEYRLYVERLNTKTGKYVFQQVKTLSTSEKLAIAIVLQMALKETYLPSIPFMLIDDVISDFDDDRKNKVLKYLSEKAYNSKWYVVTTLLDENIENIQITTHP